MDSHVVGVSKYVPEHLSPFNHSNQSSGLGTGVIYGDIGTSPLYVYSSTFTSQPSYDDLVGVSSTLYLLSMRQLHEVLMY